MPKLLQFLCSGIFMIFLSGCYNYYKVATYIDITAQQRIDSLKNENKFFILRTPTSALALKNIKTNNQDSTISFTPGIVPEEHKLHLVKRKKMEMRFKKSKPESVVLNEVHLYTSSPIYYKIGEVSQLPLNSIYHVEIIQKNKLTTTLNRIEIGLVIAGILLTVLFFVGLASGPWF
jgi:hypothetical protein